MPFFLALGQFGAGPTFSAQRGLLALGLPGLLALARGPVLKVPAQWRLLALGVLALVTFGAGGLTFGAGVFWR